MNCPVHILTAFEIVGWYIGQHCREDHSEIFYRTGRCYRQKLSLEVVTGNVDGVSDAQAR